MSWFTSDAPSHATCASPDAAGWVYLQAMGVTALGVIVDLRCDEVVQIFTERQAGQSKCCCRKALPTCNENETG